MRGLTSGRSGDVDSRKEQQWSLAYLQTALDRGKTAETVKYSFDTDNTEQY